MPTVEEFEAAELEEKRQQREAREIRDMFAAAQKALDVLADMGSYYEGSEAEDKKRAEKVLETIRGTIASRCRHAESLDDCRACPYRDSASRELHFDNGGGLCSLAEKYTGVVRELISARIQAQNYGAGGYTQEQIDQLREKLKQAEAAFALQTKHKADLIARVKELEKRRAKVFAGLK